MFQAHAVGIDLGTTFSVVAHLDESGRSQIIRNREGDVLTPSVVLFEHAEVVVGRDAKKALVEGTARYRIAEWVKRDMGQASYSRPIHGDELPPEVIQACILKKIKEDATAALDVDYACVITVPAYFDEPRRQATADAGKMAGLRVLDIVNEPTAAALAFGEYAGYLNSSGAPKERLKVLIYDLGGGTFDVTVLDIATGELKTLATDGDVRLGGIDFDDRLAECAADAFRQKYGVDPRGTAEGTAMLLAQAEKAKHTLSLRDAAVLHLAYEERSLEMPVTRQMFEALTADLVERTAYTTRQVLANAGLQWSDLSRVLLVGGSTRMPIVRHMLEDLSGIQPEHAVHPDEAVARGAAIYAGYLLALRGVGESEPSFEVVSVNAHSLGVAGIDPATLRLDNVILIPRNTPLPAEQTRKFVTKKENQRTVVIQVVEGESSLPGECTPIGRAVMRKLPDHLPRNWPIAVTYCYGTNGRLSVRAKVAGTDDQLVIELQRERGLSAEDLGRWTQVVTSEVGYDAFEDVIDEIIGRGGR